MVAHLQTRLERETRRRHDQHQKQKQKSQSENQPYITHSTISTTRKAAQVLEQLLYRSAYSLSDYQDMSTLDDRIRSVITVLLCRRLQRRTAGRGCGGMYNKSKGGTINTKTKTTTKTMSIISRRQQQQQQQLQLHQTTPSSTSQQQYRNREDALKEALGNQYKYETVRALVKNVRDVKTAKVASMRGCRCSSSTANSPPLGMNGACFRNEIRAEDHRLPQQIKDLFFHMPLVVAFDMVPMERLPHIDWDDLIQDAKCKLQSYREYNDTILS